MRTDVRLRMMLLSALLLSRNHENKHLGDPKQNERWMYDEHNTQLVKYSYTKRKIQVVPLFQFPLCITHITQMGLMDIGHGGTGHWQRSRIILRTLIQGVCWNPALWSV